MRKVIYRRPGVRRLLRVEPTMRGERKVLRKVVLVVLECGHQVEVSFWQRKYKHQFCPYCDDCKDERTATQAAS